MSVSSSSRSAISWPLGERGIKSRGDPRGSRLNAGPRGSISRGVANFKREHGIEHSTRCLVGDELAEGEAPICWDFCAVEVARRKLIWKALHP